MPRGRGLQWLVSVAGWLLLKNVLRVIAMRKKESRASLLGGVNRWFGVAGVCLIVFLSAKPVCAQFTKLRDWKPKAKTSNKVKLPQLGKLAIGMTMEEVVGFFEGVSGTNVTDYREYTGREHGWCDMSTRLTTKKKILVGPYRYRIYIEKPGKKWSARFSRPPGVQRVIEFGFTDSEPMKTAGIESRQGAAARYVSFADQRYGGGGEIEKAPKMDRRKGFEKVQHSSFSWVVPTRPTDVDCRQRVAKVARGWDDKIALTSSNSLAPGQTCSTQVTLNISVKMPLESIQGVSFYVSNKSNMEKARADHISAVNKEYGTSFKKTACYAAQFWYRPLRRQAKPVIRRSRM